ncbi:nitroreductase/quinone reductase family protein [Nocardia brevicatena]|uniref:nitroreductase/quinone reductase family protein n=1 Tax=Nocardia brevicatena TaxID=37327 RepID=UPI0002E8F70F|nr:nitroreductase/quinone reductase family protein [Nocardia brevicatena]
MTSENDRLRRRLKRLNRVVIAFQRLGLAVGTMRVLSVPGRKTGQLRTTPVSPLTVDGVMYVVGGFDDADWVRNARAAGWGVLAKGRRNQRVSLVELPASEREPVLRAFPEKVPHGVQFMIRSGTVESADPDAFAAAAPRCPVFRIEPAPHAPAPADPPSQT